MKIRERLRTFLASNKARQFLYYFLHKLSLLYKISFVINKFTGTQEYIEINHKYKYSIQPSVRPSGLVVAEWPASLIPVQEISEAGQHFLPSSFPPSWAKGAKLAPPSLAIAVFCTINNVFGLQFMSANVMGPAESPAAHDRAVGFVLTVFATSSAVESVRAPKQ